MAVNAAASGCRSCRPKPSAYVSKPCPKHAEHTYDITAVSLLLAPNSSHCCLLCCLCCLKAREVLSCRVPAGVLEQQQQLPMWQSWGAFASQDAPHPPEGVCALPLERELSSGEGGTGHTAACPSGPIVVDLDDLQFN